MGRIWDSMGKIYEKRRVVGVYRYLIRADIVLFKPHEWGNQKPIWGKPSLSLFFWERLGLQVGVDEVVILNEKKFSKCPSIY